MVAQVIREGLCAPFGSHRDRDDAVGPPTLQIRGHISRKMFYLRPRRSSRDRDDDMQPLAACGEHETLLGIHVRRIRSRKSRFGGIITGRASRAFVAFRQKFVAVADFGGWGNEFQ